MFIPISQGYSSALYPSYNRKSSFPIPKFGNNNSSRQREVENVERNWDNIAADWTANVRQGDLFKRLLLDPLFTWMRKGFSAENKVVLDLGCGEGRDCRKLLAEGAKQVVGIDLSSQLLQEARKVPGSGYAIRKERLAYEHGSILNLPYADETFDQVVSTMVLMDTPDYQQAIKEIGRVLKQEGDAFIIIKHPDALAKEARESDAQPGKPFIRKSSTGVEVIHYPYDLDAFKLACWENGLTFPLSIECSPPIPDNLPSAQKRNLERWKNTPFCWAIHLKKSLRWVETQIPFKDSKQALNRNRPIQFPRTYYLCLPI